jgi:YidC/Oxa1 family membrane protein insertase
MTVIINAFLEALLQLQAITGNLGVSILAFTLIVRSLLLPLSLPSMKSQKKMREMQPELKKLQIKHKDDKQALQAAQMELYKKYNVNPLAGCLPQLVQLGILIILYQVLIKFLAQTAINGVAINPFFFGLNLTQPDHTYVLPVLSGLSQFVLSLMILPGGETPDLVPNDSSSKKLQEANKKEEEVADMAATMQKQMLFVMPVMTGFIALRFPSGLALYWVATTVFSIAQQFFLSGPGGLTLYVKRVFAWIEEKKNG